MEFTSDELEAIDRYAVEGGINLWAASRDAPHLRRRNGETCPGPGFVRMGYP
jgi:hypothetical protein